LSPKRKVFIIGRESEGYYRRVRREVKVIQKTTRRKSQPLLEHYEKEKVSDSDGVSLPPSRDAATTKVIQREGCERTVPRQRGENTLYDRYGKRSEG